MFLQAGTRQILIRFDVIQASQVQQSLFSAKSFPLDNASNSQHCVNKSHNSTVYSLLLAKLYLSLIVDKNS